MKAILQRHHRAFFYTAWLFVNLLQAAFTPLQDDEAYYWAFSRFLDWGYFDHPPMTALLIKWGFAIFPNYLGVRLLIVFLNMATVALCERLTERKAPFLFYAVCGVLAVLQLSGFMAVPDLPLLFFTALFFYVYRLFVQQASVRNTLLLALVTAGLLYSKYHAVLIILFTLLSNIKLLRQRQTYAAGIGALLLFIPHLWWQYQHDWISFRYHLFESNVNPYKINYTTDYLLGQLLIVGPFAGFILLPALFIYKWKNLTEKALKYTGIGVLTFFFWSTFKGKVEANWTAPMVVPILVLGHQYLQDKANARKWIYKLLAPTLVLVALIRVLMMVDIVPLKVARERFHLYGRWPQALRNKWGGLPVALSSSYQMASQYWYHSGVPAYSVNEYNRRRNNYNFWPLEDSMLGKPAIVFVGRDKAQDSIQTPNGKVYYIVDSAFHAFAKVMLQPEKQRYINTFEQPLMIKATAIIPEHYRTYLLQHPEVNAPVKIGVFQNNDFLFDVPLHTTLQQLVKTPKQHFLLPLNLQKGSYFIRFAIGSDWGWFTHNSDKIEVTVK